MDNPIVRAVLASIAGIVVAGMVVALVESAGHMIYPPPPDLDLERPEDLARLLEVIPLGAKISVVEAWFLGALAGASVAGWIGRSKKPGWAVAVFMLIASVVTTLMIPHPVWMIVAAAVLPFAGKLLADRLFASRITA